MGHAFLVALALGPGLARAQVGFGDYWPNADSLSWTYHQSYHEAEWAGGTELDNQVRFFFDGRSLVPDGIEVQNLRLEAPLGSATSTSPTLAPVPTADPFDRLLWLGRPDLRDRLRQSPGFSGSGARPSPAYRLLLLHDGAYRKTDAEIAEYRRDAVNARAWLWLVDDISVGHVFRLQLREDVAPDIWLTATVAGHEDADVPAGFFPGCLRVDYEVDFGESPCVDEDGATIGAYRQLLRGHVLYAAGVGPVFTHEEWYPYYELISGRCPEAELHVGQLGSWGELELVVPPTLSVIRTSWGQVKAAFSG